MTFKTLAKQWCPPIVARGLRSLLAPSSITRVEERAQLEGTYSSWAEAAAHATGYDSSLIFEKTRDATLKVRDGRAAFERDSVIMDRPDYPLFLIAGLLHVAAATGRLSILDFGGALGSSYFQCRKYLSVIRDLRWSVVEQARYVDYGKSHLQSSALRFHSTINECVAAETPNVAILSGVLQYVQNPYAVIDEILERNLQYVVVDRQPLIHRSAEHLSVVTIPSYIYKASYPFWILSHSRFSAAWARGYEVLSEAEEKTPLASEFGELSRRQFLFVRRR